MAGRLTIHGHVSRIAMVVLLAVLVAAAAGSAHASGKNGKVAILSTSIANDVISPGPAQAFESLEAYEARSLGFNVDLIKPADWALMTTADFANYNAVVIGDPKCNHGDLAPAVSSAAVWGAAVDGNVAVLGNAPVTTYWLNHDLSSRVGSGFEVLTALKFATADSSKTGAYLDVGCGAQNAAADSSVSLLDGVAGAGAFKATGSNGACWTVGHIVDTSGALAPLNDDFLSNWPCNAASALEVFTQYPADFRPYAVTGNGSPYILLRGGVAASNSIVLEPLVGSNAIGELHTVNALVTEGGTPAAGAEVNFFLTEGSTNFGQVGNGVTGADGVASWTYDDVSGLPGTDTIQANYADSGGVVRESNTVTQTWTGAAASPDTTPPTISITSPADGAIFTLNQAVTASYNCADEAGGSGIATCTGPVADGAVLSTSTAGAHTFTVDATDTAGNPSSATTTYTVQADTTAPTVTLTTPAQGASFAQNAVVNASYSCADTGGSGLATCVGDVADGAPINTATLGNHTFTVTATDAAGNIGTAVHDYVVGDVTAPSITITGPAEGATYTLNQAATASYSCADEAGGSGLATCTGPVASGAALNTSTAGPHTFTVTATDTAGNRSTATTNYTVLTDTTLPTVSIVSPADGATFTVGQVVNASYSCADTGGSGLATCVGSVANGAAIDTASAGTKAFTVTATDHAGNTSSKVVHYTVVTPPTTGSFTVKGEGKIGKDFKFEIDVKTGPKKPSGEVEIDVKGHSFDGTVTAITITGSTAVLTGTGLDNGRRVNFTVTVTDGGNKTKDTLTVTFGTYTGGGAVTEGNIRIRQS